MRKLIEMPVDTSTWEVVPEFDTRDFLFKDVVKKGKAPTVDNFKNMHKVINQNNGSCAGETVANNAFLKTDEFCNGEATYRWTKQNECPIPNQEGTTPLAIAQGMRKFGAVREELYPRLPRIPDWQNYPTLSQAVIDDAATRKSEAFFKVNTADEYGHAIYDHGACMLAMMWLTSHDRPEICPRTGEAFIPMPSGTMRGGHLVLGVGYYPDMEYRYRDGKIYKGFGRLFNSHGSQYGKRGSTLFPLQILEEQMLDFPVPYTMDMRVNVVMDRSNLQITPLDVAPAIVASRSFLPIRALGEALGADVEWDANTREVKLCKEGRKVVMTIDSTEALVNGQAVRMDTAPFIIQGRTMVPVRFAAEFLGGTVEWDNGRIETITTGDSAVMFIGEKYLLTRRT